MKAQFVVALALLCSALNVVATMGGIPSLERLFSEADVVAVVVVEERETHCSGTMVCGYLYTGMVVESLKGFEVKRDSDKIRFGRTPQLAVGGKYLLFLGRIGSADDVLRGKNWKAVYPLLARSEIPEEIKSSQSQSLKYIECDGIAPGYMAHPMSLWEVNGDLIILGKFLPAAWPTNLKYTIRSDGSKVVNKDELWRYLRQL